MTNEKRELQAIRCDLNCFSVLNTPLIRLLFGVFEFVLRVKEFSVQKKENEQ